MLQTLEINLSFFLNDSFDPFQHFVPLTLSCLLVLIFFIFTILLSSTGIIADLHGRGGPQGGCGAVGLRAVEEVAAAEWALATINNQSQHDYTIGNLPLSLTCGLYERVYASDL